MTRSFYVDGDEVEDQGGQQQVHNQMARRLHGETRFYILKPKQRSL
jgi:hypothetical protein